MLYIREEERNSRSSYLILYLFDIYAHHDDVTITDFYDYFAIEITF